MENDLDAINKKTIRQERQINQLRAKMFSLHEAMIGIALDRRESLNTILPYEIENNKSAKTVIAFGGMLTALGMPKAEFFNSFDKNNNLNFIFLKDFWQSWYQKGLLGIANDVESLADFIREIVPVESQELYCVGTSAGGFAAILFAELLNAKKSLSFGPQTNVDLKTFLRFRAPESKWDEIKSSKYLDLRNIVSGEVNHILYVSSKNEIDSEQAENLRLLPKVHVNFIDSESHNIAGFLKRNDGLQPVLQDFLNS